MEQRLRSGVGFERLEPRLCLSTVTFTTPSSNGGDGTWVLEQRDGTDVYVGPAYLYYNTNPFVAFPGFQQGDPLYAKVNYYDEGSGTLKVQYDSVAENFDQTEFHTRSSRVDTQQFVSSYHFLDNASFLNGSNGHDFRVVVDGVPVASVEVSNQPFPDSGLDWVWSPPWEAPYTGPSREVDASTLAGKVLAGYQGWFNTPNDAADEGYVHWGVPGDWSIEQWPDANDYDSSELFAVPGVNTASGEQAYLFSSANDSVVDRHFQWMREHDVDGVLLQRFRPSFMYKQPDGSYAGEPQWPVVNARDAAHREGRTWAIEYDIQNGGSTAERDQVIQDVKDDWEYLTDPNGMDMLNDSHYQREDGKPVVAIFGLYVGSTNKYSNAQQADLINYFQSRGVYVVGAGRGSQTGGAEQLANVGLHDAYISWQGYWRGGDSYAADEAAMSGLTNHIPHIFPGFSWTHLRNDDTATSRDREDGNFYWRMISDAANETNAPWYFIGMFDEYDEGTNIIPATDDPPVPDTDPDGDPLTYQVSDPMPNDWWMALTGRAKQALQGKISINDTIPTETELENRSNVGGEVVWEASGSDRLDVLDIPGGQIQTTTFVVDGVAFDAVHSDDDYIYFQIDDGFLFQATDGRDVTIEVEYLDSVAGQFSVEYDSTYDVYESAAPAALTGSGHWRTHRFNLSDAYFGGNQDGGADFRLVKSGGDLFVRSIRVIKEQSLAIDTDLGSIDTINGLEPVELAGDGQTTTTTIDGREVKQITGSANSLYMYMRVDDDFASDVHAGLNAVIEVVYKDVGTGSFKIQYDATSNSYQNSSSIGLQNTGEWRTARFYLDDAFFGNSQNGMSDFRITGSSVPIDKVRVLHSFGDLMAPELQSSTVSVDPVQSTVTIAWTMADDWRTGSMDQWTMQEDNRALIEWTNDAGTTWNFAGELFQHAGPTSVSGYDLATGRSIWSDEFIWDTASLPAGTYQIRVTPTDGRGNVGASVESAPLTVNAPPALPGDYDYSGNLDPNDVAVWSASYGSQVPSGTGADGTSDGVVNGLDFLFWQSQFSSPPLSVVETEPASEQTLSEPISESIAPSAEPVSVEILAVSPALAADEETSTVAESEPLRFFLIQTDSSDEDVLTVEPSVDQQLYLLLAQDVANATDRTIESEVQVKDDALVESENESLRVDREMEPLFEDPWSPVADQH